MVPFRPLNKVGLFCIPALVLYLTGTERSVVYTVERNLFPVMSWYFQESVDSEVLPCCHLLQWGIGWWWKHLKWRSRTVGEGPSGSGSSAVNRWLHYPDRRIYTALMPSSNEGLGWRGAEASRKLSSSFVVLAQSYFQLILHSPPLLFLPLPEDLPLLPLEFLQVFVDPQLVVGETVSPWNNGVCALINIVHDAGDVLGSPTKSQTVVYISL